jgi:bleomycin hydrolase
LYNALTRNDARQLVFNRAILQANNDLFSNKVKAKGITDQKGSGRCWMFAAFNTMRPAVMEKHKLDEFEFSTSYLSFWDKLEKANFFLETMIDFRDRDFTDREYDFFVKDPINDGGWWVMVVALVEKYGVMPKDAMPETFPSEHTDAMNKVLEAKLRVGAAQLRRMAAEKKTVPQMREEKKKMLAEIYRILVLNYGLPPTEFTYRYADKDKKIIPPKKYTPQSFYKEWVGVDLSQYVHLVNDPTQPYGKHYRMRRVRGIVNAHDVNYVNVPIDVLKSVVVKSIVDNQGAVFSCDAGRDMDAESGVMQVGLFDFASLYGVDLTLGKADALRTRGGVANHAMVFIGVDLQDNKPVKWLVENSWGVGRGRGGLMTMYDKWFEEHVYDSVVRKAYVPNDVLKIFQEEPVELPPYNPLNTFFGG